jgi:hypothetical protein
MVTDARGIPLGAVPAPANRNDHALLGATLEALPPLGPLPAGGTVHLDRGYDYQAVRDELAARGLHARFAERGKPAPIQPGHRWVIERTHAWMNNYGKLIPCTEHHKPVVEFYLALASAIVTLGRLIRQAWSCYRWQTRPRRRP